MADHENIRPFLKAVSAAPAFHPISDAYRRLISERLSSLRTRKPRTVAEAIALAVLRKALRGDVDAAVEVANRIEGKPTQPLVGAGGAPLIPEKS